METVPDRLEIIAGTPPGGGQDRAARALAAAIEEASPVAVTVSNVVGRGGGAAWETLEAQAGEPVLAISSPTLLSNHLHDPGEPGADDLTHVAMLCTEPLLFAVPANSPIRSASEVLDWLGRGAIRVSIATALGNVNHMAVADVASHAGVAVERVPVSAFGSALDAVSSLGVDSELAVVSAASALDAIARGDARALALSSPVTVGGDLAGVPLWTELGVTTDRSTWRGVVAPPDMPGDVRRSVEHLLATAVTTTPWQDAVVRHAWVPLFLVGSEAEAFVAGESESMRASLERLGMLDG